MSEVTYCRIRNTLELADAGVSENLVAKLTPGAEVVSDPFEVEFDASGDFTT